MRVTIVGGGIFGLAAAATLAIRGHAVTLHEAGDIPAEKAASNDISKALRLEYGPETPTYAPWVLAARDGWRALERRTGRRIYFETGYLACARRFQPGAFEYQSWTWVEANGLAIERLTPRQAAARFPGFRFDGLETCTFNPIGGWLDPQQALPAFAEVARAHGAEIRTQSPVRDLDALTGDAVLVAAGPWLGRLLPRLGVPVRTTRQHEALYRPADLRPFADGRLPVWSFDIAGEGWYGFPLHPDGIVKVARHVPDLDADPDVARDGDPEQAGRIDAFVRARMPGLAGAPADGRTCLYTMSPDCSFLFDRVPQTTRVFVAGCGSGHAFKFGPLLGQWAADLVEGKPVPEAFRCSHKEGARVI